MAFIIFQSRYEETGVPTVAQWVKNLTAADRSLQRWGFNLALPQLVKGSCVVADAAQIQSLARKLAYAMGAAIKKKKKIAGNKVCGIFLFSHLSSSCSFLWEHASSMVILFSLPTGINLGLGDWKKSLLFYVWGRENTEYLRYSNFMEGD